MELIDFCCFGSVSITGASWMNDQLISGNEWIEWEMKSMNEPASQARKDWANLKRLSDRLRQNEWRAKAIEQPN